MRLTATIGLLLAATFAATGRPDNAKVWNWPREKSFRDGPVKLEVEALTGEADLPEWEISFRVSDPGTGRPAPDETNARFAGAKAYDDTGAEVPFVRYPQTPRSLSFPKRPSQKAKTVYIQLGPINDRPEVKLAIPAATIRGLTAKTSYFLKTTR